MPIKLTTHAAAAAVGFEEVSREKAGEIEEFSRLLSDVQRAQEKLGIKLDGYEVAEKSPTYQALTPAEKKLFARVYNEMLGTASAAFAAVAEAPAPASSANEPKSRPLTQEERAELAVKDFYPRTLRMKNLMAQLAQRNLSADERRELVRTADAVGLDVANVVLEGSAQQLILNLVEAAGKEELALRFVDAAFGNVPAPTLAPLDKAVMLLSHWYRDPHWGVTGVRREGDGVVVEVQSTDAEKKTAYAGSWLATRGLGDIPVTVLVKS